MTLPNEALLFSHYLKQDTSNASFASVRTFSSSFADRTQALAWFDTRLIGFVELDSGNQMQLNHRGGTTNWFAGVGQNWRRLEVMHDLPRHKLKARLDGGAWTNEVDTRGADNATIQSLALEGERQSGTFGVDNFIIRRYLAIEPTVTVGPEQAR